MGCNIVDLISVLIGGKRQDLFNFKQLFLNGRNNGHTEKGLPALDILLQRAFNRLPISSRQFERSPVYQLQLKVTGF